MRTHRCRRAAIIAGGLILIAAPGPAMELYLKTTGGLLRSGFADINAAVKDWSAYWKASAAAREDWGYEQTGILKQPAGLSFGAELLASFRPRWAVGMGVGVLYSNFTDKGAPLYIQTPADKIEYTSPTKIAAYPVYGLGQYSLPLTPKWDLTAFAGLGVVSARYVHREKFRNLKDAAFGVALAEIASGTGAMILGGGGVRYAIDPALSLFLEAGYVRAKAGSFKGTTGESGEGILYYYQEFDADADLWQTKLRLHAAEPFGEGLRAVRKAAADLSGFSLRLGLMMKL